MSDNKENSLEQTSSPSPEEEDLIRRSTKKQKGEGSFLPPRTLRSYRDLVVNPEGCWQDQIMQDPLHTEEINEAASDVEDNIEDDIPVILLSKAEKERINAPWRSALIIKVFDTCPSKIVPSSPASPRTPEPIPPPTSKQDSSNYGKWMIVSRRKSAAKKAVQKNANTVPRAPTSSNASTHRNTKSTNSTPRDSPLEPHKDPMSSSSIPINRDKGNPPKSGQSVSPNQPPSTHNTQIFTHRSDIINATHFEKPNTILPFPTDNTPSHANSLDSHNSASCHHVTYPSDHTSSHSMKINSHLPTDKVPASPPLPNPRTSMDIDTTKVSFSTEIHSNTHIITDSCPRTLVTHGSTSSSLPPEPSQYTKQSLPPKQKPKCPSSTQTSPPPTINPTINPTITHIPTLPNTHTNHTVSGELGSTQEGYTASHWRSSSEVASGLPDPILDSSRSRNGTSPERSNPSNPREYTVRPGSHQSDVRTSDCVSHNHAHLQRFPPLERTPSSDSWTSTDQENTEWHGDNIRATRCRSPRSHDHSNILGKHPDPHSFPDDRQNHHSGGNSSETSAIPIINRPPSTRHASRALLPSGDEPKCTINSCPQSESPKQSLHQEERVFRGAGNPNFRRNFAELLRSHRPSIAILVETRVSGQRAEDISSMLGFNRVCRSDAVGFRGGI
ncbi:receptor like protein 30 [Fagus crenata]